MPVILWLLALGAAGYYFIIRPDIVLVECRDHSSVVRVEFEMSSFLMARATDHDGVVTVSHDFFVRTFRAVDQGDSIHFFLSSENFPSQGSFRRQDAVLSLPDNGWLPAFTGYCQEITPPL